MWVNKETCSIAESVDSAIGNGRNNDGMRKIQASYREKVSVVNSTLYNGHNTHAKSGNDLKIHQCMLIIIRKLAQNKMRFLWDGS